MIIICEQKINNINLFDNKNYQINLVFLNIYIYIILKHSIIRLNISPIFDNSECI